MKRAHIIIHGHVHGVFFRVTTLNAALKLGLKGYVRNIPEGKVEIIAEGKEKKLKELIEFCHHGPPSARVEKVTVIYSEPTKEFTTFEIRY